MARSQRTAGDGTHFRRQAPIGPYIVDFFCPAAHLIIELDGGHHNEDDTAQRDRERQLWLEREGFRVVRFWNSDITGDPTSVLERIYVELYGSREAEVETLKHFRRGKTVTPPRPHWTMLRIVNADDPPPSGEGERKAGRVQIATGSYAAASRKCSTNSFAGRGSALKLRAQITSLRFAQESLIRIIAIGIDCAHRLAAASGTTATPTPAATIWQIASKSRNRARTRKRTPSRAACLPI